MQAEACKMGIGGRMRAGTPGAYKQAWAAGSLRHTRVLRVRPGCTHGMPMVLRGGQAMQRRSDGRVANVPLHLLLACAPGRQGWLRQGGLVKRKAPPSPSLALHRSLIGLRMCTCPCEAGLLHRSGVGGCACPCIGRLVTHITEPTKQSTAGGVFCTRSQGPAMKLMEGADSGPARMRQVG